MIDNPAWQAILATANDLSTVCEFYPSDAAPTDDGFDPADAVACFAAVAGIEFMGVEYQRLVDRFGSINRKVTAEKNTAKVTFSNLSREISDFEFATGFEGLIMVIRLISRSQSVDNETSQILFTGRCEKPTGGNKASFTVSATWILGGLEVQIPRRKYSKEDQEGRVETDPEFEGFIFKPQYGTVSWPRRVRRGGFAGFLGFKKTIFQTLAYSSHSDVEENKVVPFVFGRVQLMGTHIAYQDVGTYIRLRTAFCDGGDYGIEGYENVRSIDSQFVLDSPGGWYAECYGLTGAANGDDPAWVGPGYYSRTAYIRTRANNSLVEEDDPAPDVVAILIAILVPNPDGSGDWVEIIWCDNAAALVRYILTSNDFYKLAEAWIDDPSFYETYQYNNGLIIDRSLTDFVFIQEG